MSGRIECQPAASIRILQSLLQYWHQPQKPYTRSYCLFLHPIGGIGFQLSSLLVQSPQRCSRRCLCWAQLLLLQSLMVLGSSRKRASPLKLGGHTLPPQPPSTVTEKKRYHGQEDSHSYHAHDQQLGPCTCAPSSHHQTIH
jgi:hypothetical protein